MMMHKYCKQNRIAWRVINADETNKLSAEDNRMLWTLRAMIVITGADKRLKSIDSYHTKVH